MSYQDFVARKLSTVPPTGITGRVDLAGSLFPHQAALTQWALKRGRAAIFADTGLGKMRMGIPDYLITVRAPGESEHVTHTVDEFPVDMWQRYASPVWMDINPSETLQYTSAREHDDERHICPLQLEVIRRGVMLWTNPDDIVLSPFMGIGSEGYVALEMGRRFVGVELKASYYGQATRNLDAATRKMDDLFAVAV